MVEKIECRAVGAGVLALRSTHERSACDFASLRTRTLKSTILIVAMTFIVVIDVQVAAAVDGVVDLFYFVTD